jgi:hypothetical protein
MTNGESPGKPVGFELLRKRGNAAIKVPPRPCVIAKKSIRRKPDGFFYALRVANRLLKAGCRVACENLPSPSDLP